MFKKGRLTLKITAKYLACLGIFVIAVPMAMAQTPTTAQQTQEANIKAYIEMLRQDVKKDKVSILTELMDFGPGDAAKFWPVYNEYDTALTKLADERIAVIRMYAENYDALSDEMATQIATSMMDIEGRRVELRKQYLPRMIETLGAKAAVRWLQIEAQIEKVLDLQILASLPIVE